MVDVDPEPIPDELQDRDQWLMWDNSHDTPRQPHWRGDFSISWSDPDDWHSFAEALAAAQKRDSWGVGYVMALDNSDHGRGLYGCLDLDGCLDTPDSPVDWLPSLDWAIHDDAYIERSPSGDGLHIPLFNPDVPDWWRDSHFSADEHEGVELLTNKFVTFTGDQLGDQHAGVTAADPTEFLYESYETLNSEAPRTEPASTSAGDHDDLDREDVREALSHVSSNCGYQEWRNVLFAVRDWDDGQRGKSLAEQWSRGPAYDSDAERTIESVWDRDASPSDPITVGTLIHKAMDGGWEPPQPEGQQTAETVEELVARYSEEYDDPEAVPDDILATEGDDDGETGDSEGAEGPNWQPVLQAYKAAGDAAERQPARYEAVNALERQTAWRCIQENDTLWAYDTDAGIFRQDGEARIRETLVKELKEQYRGHEASEIEQQIRGRFTVNHDDMGGDDQMVATENKVLEVERDGVTVHEHDPSYNFIGRVQTPYRPEADCPRFRAFLNEAVDSGEARRTLQEYAGYCLMHWDLPYHKSLFLVGPTASGKSTFLDTIRAMLGQDAVVSLTPQQMSGEKFSGAELYGSWANIRNDIPASMIKETGQFKEIVAGDPVKAEEKNEDPFFFQPTAKHVFSANELPDTDTDDEAFFRRILLVAFPRTVPRGQRDPDLDDKLIQELPGILNWALEGLQRLRQKGRFSQDRLPGQTQDTWEKWGNSISRFESACLDDGDQDIAKSEVYQAYVAFCEDEGIPTETQHKMTRELKLEGYRDGQAYIDGSQTRVFTNMDWTGRGGQYRDQDSDDDRYNGGGSLGNY